MNYSKTTKPNKDKRYFTFRIRPSYGGDLRIVYKENRAHTGNEVLNKMIIDPDSLEELKNFLKVSPEENTQVGRFQKIYTIGESRKTTVFILDTTNGKIGKEVIEERPQSSPINIL